MSTASNDAVQAGTPSLAAVVERQRRENEHLRSALRTRAVIEQAKGILVARSGTDPETAFHQLVAHSQRSNRKLVHIAAEVVAHTITSPIGAARRESQEAILDEATAWDAGKVLTAAAVLAAPDLDELLQTVIQYTRRFGVAAGMLALAETDGAVRIVGVHGYESHVVSGWQRIPPGTEVPLSAVAEGRTPLWCASRVEREERFAGSVRFPAHLEACAALPLEVDGQLVGVLSLDWEEPRNLNTDTRGELEAVAHFCAPPLAELLHGYHEELPGLDFEPGRAPWFWVFLDGQPIPQLVLEPVLVDDHVADLRVIYANQEARALTGLRLGDSLFERVPSLAEGGLMRTVREATRGGDAFRIPPDSLPPELSQDGRSRELSVSWVGSSIVASWGPPKT